jgi:hypothetical protein
MAIGCYQEPPCYLTGLVNYTNYNVQVTSRTTAGVSIDDPKGELDQRKIDNIIITVLECVRNAKLVPANLCYGEPAIEVRSCLVIKVAPDWHTSACTGEQGFGDAPVASCEAKGQTPTKECPCSFRAITQDNGTVITTPNLKLLPAQLTSLFSGCDDPWHGDLAVCAQPL